MSQQPTNHLPHHVEGTAPSWAIKKQLLILMPSVTLYFLWQMKIGEESHLKQEKINYTKKEVKVVQSFKKN